MGMAIKDWQKLAPEICFTNCGNLSKEFKGNRQILFETMVSHGFVNYPIDILILD